MYTRDLLLTSGGVGDLQAVGRRTDVEVGGPGEADGLPRHGAVELDERLIS